MLTMKKFSVALLAVFVTAFFLPACGGGSQALTVKHQQLPSPQVVSNARVGDGWAYADADWNYPDPAGRWIVRGTCEDDAFAPCVPVWWFYDSSNQQGVPWWTLQNTSAGFLIHTAPPASNHYMASFPGDVWIKSFPIDVSKHVTLSQRPILNLDYSIPNFSGAKARATVGISMRLPDFTQVYVEQNLQRTESFALCADKQFDRCQGAVTYFPPGPFPIDIRALVLRTPGMTPAIADTIFIAGVYIGTECYGACSIDLLVKSYSVTVQP